VPKKPAQPERASAVGSSPPPPNKAPPALPQDLPGMVTKDGSLLQQKPTQLQGKSHKSTAMSLSAAGKMQPQGLQQLSTPTTSRSTNDTPASYRASKASHPLPTKTKSSKQMSNQLGRQPRYDAVIIHAPEEDITRRADAVAQGLEAQGLSVCKQSEELQGTDRCFGSSVKQDGFILKCAEASACAVLLLTRRFIERVEAGAIGDVCIAGFALTKSITNLLVVTMEPGLAHPSNWGWNKVFARLSHRIAVDLSMDQNRKGWREGILHLSYLVKPCLSQPIEKHSMEAQLLRKAATAAEHPTADQYGLQALKAPVAALPPDKEDACIDRVSWRMCDCFLSHDWGLDSKSRDTHQRVRLVAQVLRRHGLDVFFDEWEMQHYSNTDDAMVSGLRHAFVAVVFMTRRYIDTVETGAVSENCVAEFNLVARSPDVIPVVMEPELRSVGAWGLNKVYTHLSGKQMVDLSSDAGCVSRMLVSDAAQRWFSAVDALELRIRQEAAQASWELHQQRFSPFIPHRDLMSSIVTWLAFGTVLLFISAFWKCLPSNSGEDDLNVLTALSAVLLSLGFGLLVLWHLQRARIPPDFGISLTLLPQVAMLASALQSIGAFLLVVHPIGKLTNPGGSFTSINLVAAYVLLGGHCLALSDALVFSQGLPNGFNPARLLCFNNLPHFATGGFFLGSILLAPAEHLVYLNSEVKSRAAPLRLICSVVWVAGVTAYAVWVAASPRQLRRHFDRLMV